MVSPERSFVFVARRDSTTRTGIVISSHALPIAYPSLAEKVRSFAAQVAGRALDFRTSARNLYEVLLQPAEREISTATTLIIIPDDFLWSIPFQALEAPDRRLLIETKVILLAPSAAALLEMEKRRKVLEHSPRHQLTLIAMGAPVNKASGAVPLPDSKREVLELRDLYGAKRSHVYVGADATEMNLRTDATRSRIAHLATHGVLDDRSPMHSYLLLSSSGSGGEDDGYLEATELMNMRLPELTILSACDTARGRYGAGEGVIGLSWAILVAGGPASVVSQWSVDSSSTTELMLSFHRRLSASIRDGSPLHAAASLRLASLDLLKSERYRHPFYWAGFSVIGAGR